MTRSTVRSGYSAARVCPAARQVAINVAINAAKAAPCLVATAVFGFMSSWGSFLYPLLFTSSPENATLPVIISNFTTDLNADYGLLSTSGVFAILPPFLLALWFQRWIVSGVASGAVKG